MISLHMDRLNGDVAAWLIPLVAAAVFTGRYLVMAGGALVLLKLFERRVSLRRIQPGRFTRAQLWREAGYSASSIAIFAAITSALFAANSVTPVIRFYSDPDQYGWLWFAASLPAAILLHDLYFYAAHRFMHLPGVFERVHRVHHLSTNPSPLAAFAFHPAEAVIEAMGIVLIVMILPMHPAIMVTFGLFTLAVNVMGHLGHELLPRGWSRHPFLGLANTATSHNQHHRTYAYNFGLYTLIWDRIFGTQHPAYHKSFDRVSDTALRSANPNPPPSST